MEEDGIGMVLVKATELRSKITDCIDKTTSSRKQNQQPNGASSVSTTLIEPEAKGKDAFGSQISDVDETDAEVEYDDDEEAESLLNIRDALETLESQLSSLKALQQQQSYEKESALAEIDHSRRLLLTKLKEYKGDDLQVIHEASAFASESVSSNDDLLLPPYIHTPRPLLINNNFPTNNSQNRIINGLSVSRRDQLEPSRSFWNGLGRFLDTTTKMAITIVGVVAVLKLSGFEPKLKGKNTGFKYLGVFREPALIKGKVEDPCPHGKVLVVENGESRCLVKERVEIPFGSAVPTPDVNYGFG